MISQRAIIIGLLALLTWDLGLDVWLDHFRQVPKMVLSAATDKDWLTQLAEAHGYE